MSRVDVLRVCAAAVAAVAVVGPAPSRADAPTVVAASPAPPRHSALLALASLDGAAGLELGIERGVAPRLGVAISGSARKAADGDYDGWALGIAGEARWYWRGTVAWPRPHGSDRVGWFVGARLDGVHDRLSMDCRTLGSTWTIGVAAELGYKLTPWRGLELAALVSAGQRLELAPSGRLPAHLVGGLGVGLNVGWMF